MNRCWLLLRFSKRSLCLPDTGWVGVSAGFQFTVCRGQVYNVEVTWDLNFLSGVIVAESAIPSATKSPTLFYCLWPMMSCPSKMLMKREHPHIGNRVHAW